MTFARKPCSECNDTGTVNGPGGIDACPDCARAAETAFRQAQVFSEQQAKKEAA